MAGFDLTSLTLKELRKLQKDVGQAIETFEDRKRKEALAEVEAVAREKGFTLSELTAIARQQKRKPAAPKYANPKNPDMTWSGRGRRPKWIEEALAAGKSLDDLAI